LVRHRDARDFTRSYQTAGKCTGFAAGQKATLRDQRWERRSNRCGLDADRSSVIDLSFIPTPAVFELGTPCVMEAFLHTPAHTNTRCQSLSAEFYAGRNGHAPYSDAGDSFNRSRGWIARCMTGAGFLENDAGTLLSGIAGDHSRDHGDHPPRARWFPKVRQDR
jgi:hypothetical protein